MNGLFEQLVALPIVVPLLAGAAMLLLTEARRAARVGLALLSSVIQLAVALVLLYLTSDAAPFIWHEGVGDVLLELGDRDQAVAQYEQALKFAPRGTEEALKTKITKAKAG